MFWAAQEKLNFFIFDTALAVPAYPGTASFIFFYSKKKFIQTFLTYLGIYDALQKFFCTL